MTIRADNSGTAGVVSSTDGGLVAIRADNPHRARTAGATREVSGAATATASWAIISSADTCPFNTLASQESMAGAEAEVVGQCSGDANLRR